MILNSIETIQEPPAKTYKMILKFFFAIALAVITAGKDGLTDFHKELSYNLGLYLSLPPNSNAGDTCYHYSELLMVQIGNGGKVSSITLSDSAPLWLREDLERVKNKGLFKMKKLDSIAYNNKMANCKLLFHLMLESDDYPCGTEAKKRNIDDNFFMFNKKRLSGNIFFGQPIKLVFSTDYKR